MMNIARLFLIFVTCLTTSFAVAETRRAVIIGIDQYIVPGATLVGRGEPPDTRFWMNLDGAVNDAIRIRDLMIARYGFERDDIVFLQNQEASRDAIIDAIEDHLIDKTQSGDVAFLYYAGHGSRVRNSLSSEMDKLDESFVPADAATGARDIRDKEMRDLLNRIIDKGGIVSVVLDSCHSGSGTRGPAGPLPAKTRRMIFDPRDVRDDSSAPSPWERGALVFSATQKDQEAAEDYDEFGIEGGLFTMSFARALRTSSPDEPAQNLFRRVSALMKASGKDQDPGLEGTDVRKGQSLFGETGGGPVGRTVASVQSVSGESVVLQEGIAAGLTEGTELLKIDDPSVRIAIDAVTDLVTSKATIKSGGAGSIRPGDLFVVDKWAPPNAPNLWVFVPETNQSAADLNDFANELARVVSGRGHRWVTNPTKTIPTHVVRYDGQHWQFIAESGEPVDLGPTVTATGIADRLPDGSRVYLNLPAPRAFARAIRLGEGTSNNAIALSSDGARADYHLMGSWENGRLSYAWVRPWISSPSESTMPWVTDWVSLGGPPDTAARKLERLAVRLGHINAWLRLEGPPQSSAFPYRLALKAEGADRFVSEGAVQDGERYSLALHTTRSPLTEAAWRYVYVFAIDSYGKSTVLYPQGGATENRFPPEEDTENPRSSYELPNSNFVVQPPYGVDTFVLIAATSQLPDPSVLSSSGVRTRSASARSSYGLGDLLQNVGSNSRGTGVDPAPTEWSIQRISLEARP